MAVCPSVHLVSDHPCSASNYFHLPVDEDEDELIASYQKKYLTYTAPDPYAPSSSTSHIRLESIPEEEPLRFTVVNQVLRDEDLYSILGLSRSVKLDKATLRRAYLSRSKACHPEWVITASFIS